MRGRFIGPLSDDVRIVLQARQIRPFVAAFLLAIGLPLLCLGSLLLFISTLEVFLFPIFLGFFAVAWARNIWARWRLAAGIISLCYCVLGVVTWLTMLKPGYAPGAEVMNVVVLFTLATAIAGAVLFIPAWYEERTRVIPAPLPRSQQSGAADSRHQLPSSVKHTQTPTKER